MLHDHTYSSNWFWSDGASAESPNSRKVTTWNRTKLTKSQLEPKIVCSTSVKQSCKEGFALATEISTTNLKRSDKIQIPLAFAVNRQPHLALLHASHPDSINKFLSNKHGESNLKKAKLTSETTTRTRRGFHCTEEEISLNSYVFAHLKIRRTLKSSTLKGDSIIAVRENTWV